MPNITTDISYKSNLKAMISNKEKKLRSTPKLSIKNEIIQVKLIKEMIKGQQNWMGKVNNISISVHQPADVANCNNYKWDHTVIGF